MPSDYQSPVWEFHKANADGSKGEYVKTEYGYEVKLQLLPMDYVVTERGVYQRIDGKLVLLDAPAREHTVPGYSSPACLAHEIAPGYFGETPKKPES